MPYAEQITRVNPTCFLFLVDQSGSMRDPVGGDGSGRSKAQGVADALNRLLIELTEKSQRAEGIRDYFHVGVVGYGKTVQSVFSGPSSGSDIVPMSSVADNPVRVESRTRKREDGAGGLVDETIRMPVWVDPVAEDGTPMCEALRKAHTIVGRWLKDHPRCYPPTVLNLTDGDSTDGDPLPLAQEIGGLASQDGSVVLYNLHISSHNATPVRFPESSDGLPDQYAEMLFRMSSTLPAPIRAGLAGAGLNIGEHSRGFVFNADMVSVVQFLDVGTRVNPEAADR